MRISVLGAGAMGSLFGGLLTQAGHNVELLEINEAHIAFIRDKGLQIDTDQGSDRVSVRICRPEDSRFVPDWMFVFTKTLHTSTAMASARHLVGEDTSILSLQNGLGNAEKLTPFASKDRVAIGVTTVPADLVGPGHVRSHGLGKIRTLMVQPTGHSRLSELAAALTEAGLPCEVDPNVHAAIWEKVAFNAALNSICAVSLNTVGQVGASVQGRALAHDIADEVLRVASAHGVAVLPSQVHDTLEHAMDHHTNHKPSMLQDVLAGRPTEIDAICGKVIELADPLGVSVPTVRAMNTLVRLRQSASPGPSPV